MTIPTNYGRLAWHLSGPALPLRAVVTLGLSLAEFGGSGGLPQIVDEVLPSAEDLFQAVCVDSCTMESLSLKCGPDTSGPTYTAVSGAVGGTSGNPAPPNTSLLVTEQVVGLSGRFNGRMFWPGIDEGSIGDGGAIGSTGPYQAVFNGFQLALNDLGLVPVVLTDMEGASPRTVDTFIVQSVVASQRRRLRR